MTPEEQYLKAKNPSNLVKAFKDDQEFIEWCNEGTLEDLYCALEAFKTAQLYWYCVLISNVIRDKEANIEYPIHLYLEPMVLIDRVPFYGVGELIDFGDGIAIELNYN